MSRPGRRLLLVAFHFPPAYGSGVQRMLAFTRDLPQFGWQVDVLTITPRAFPETASERLGDIPPGTRVIRACGLDTARHLSLFGKYPRLLSLPDRWVSWRPAAVLAGLAHIRREPPDALLSSFPIATAHLVARDLARLSGLPWVADFRDPMAQDEYPKTEVEWNCFRRIEQRTIDEAAACTFTAPGALEYYRARYGEAILPRCHIVPNGYDDEVFAEVERETRPTPRADAPLVFLHSGLLYPWERDPLPFFRALKALDDAGLWRRHPARFVFRASGFDEHFGQAVRELGIAHLVEFHPRIDYRGAVREILAADALLLFQAANSNFQIPAKSYEYLRARRPVLAVVDPAGDSAALLATQPGNEIVDIASEPDIRRGLERLVPALAARPRGVALDDIDTRRYSRTESARVLAAVLDQVAGGGDYRIGGATR